jgi:hypothetical protein
MPACRPGGGRVNDEKALQMSQLRSLPSAAAIALALVGYPAWAENQPQLTPTRDVDITYKITQQRQKPITERVRWSASEYLERVDGPNKSTSIFDHNAHVDTLLNGASRTYRKLENAPRQLLEPEPGAVLKRGSDAVVAGLPCTDWSWTEDVEKHTVCVTPDGVVLRLVIDESKTVMEARSVRYAWQPAELFRVPPSYAPALAPEGGGPGL